ncbi:MAG TPA: hypothetical protein VFZ65_08870 [Planctomycetota bacterium]|nr:hypothetical protein [Planctomycetota bacterium]
MSDKKKPGVVGKKFKLFVTIFLVLLVPMVMDQAGVDRDAVLWSGRISAGLTVLLTIYGLMAKVFKTFVFVLFGLIALVFLVSEGHIKAPRLMDAWAERK